VLGTTTVDFIGHYGTVFFEFLRLKALMIIAQSDDLITKAAFAVATFVLGVLARNLWTFANNIFDRWTNQDSYSALYGKWFVYRVGKQGILRDTQLTIQKRWFAGTPKCLFFTKHVGHGVKSVGSCKIYGTTLAIHFDRYAKRTQVKFGSFGFWLKHVGASELETAKYGYMSGILSDGEIFSGEVIASRTELDPENVFATLPRTKTASADQSAEFVMKALGAAPEVSRKRPARTHLGKDARPDLPSSP
jgi:hypothetical protein